MSAPVPKTGQWPGNILASGLDVMNDFLPCKLQHLSLNLGCISQNNSSHFKIHLQFEVQGQDIAL